MIKSKRLRVWLSLMVAIGLLYLAFYLNVNRRLFLIPSESMEDTLNKSDYVVAFSYGERGEPEVGEIVVFAHPQEPKSFYVKRVVGRPGDVIEIREGTLFRNGQYVSEPYIKEEMVYFLPPQRVPPEHLFVLGDNRNNSSDSADWGFLPMKNVVGKVAFIYSPISRMGPVHSSYPPCRHQASGKEVKR